MENYKTEYGNYSNSVAIMVSTDRLIFLEKSQVRARMVEYSKLYKELHIIVFSNQRIEPITISNSCKIYSTNSLIRLNYVKDASVLGKRILKCISKNMPLLVTCQDPFETALVGKYIANLRKDSELLIQIHTELFSPYFTSKQIGYKNSFLNKIRLFISRFTLPHAHVIRVVSNKIADSLVQKGITKDKIIVKPIEVNTDYISSVSPSFDLRKKFPKYKKIALVVARLEDEKNVGMAIEALKMVDDSKIDLGLVVVGSGSNMGKLKKQAYTSKLDSKVVFEGWQTDLTPYYKGADLLIVTSWYEGYGMVFKEAQTAGLAIVSTDVGIAKDVGATIVDWNAKDLAQKLINILS